MQVMAFLRTCLPPGDRCRTEVPVPYRAGPPPMSADAVGVRGATLRPHDRATGL